MKRISQQYSSSSIKGNPGLIILIFRLTWQILPDIVRRQSIMESFGEGGLSAWLELGAALETADLLERSRI
jgi:hypothetical protein